MKAAAAVETRAPKRRRSDGLDNQQVPPGGGSGGEEQGGLDALDLIHLGGIKSYLFSTVSNNFMISLCHKLLSIMNCLKGKKKKKHMLPEYVTESMRFLIVC